MTTVYENELFKVELVSFRDPVIESEVTGYGVFNKETTVREAEARRLAYARILADKFELELREQDMEALVNMPAANLQAV